jgi:hypothetical protein
MNLKSLRCDWGKDMTKRPAFRLICCLCQKPIPRRQDVYPLDAEWKRRFPAMNGQLACDKCALRANLWICNWGDPNHIPQTKFSNRPVKCIDSWSHVEPQCTHIAAMLRYPESARIQGGSEYIKWAIERRPTILKDWKEAKQ